MQIRVYKDRTTYEPLVEDDDVLHEEGEGYVGGIEADSSEMPGEEYSQYFSTCACFTVLHFVRRRQPSPVQWQ
jgi:hypothetical protein